MKVKEISINVSRKVNLGNFESEGLGFTATAEINDNEDLEEKKDELLSTLQFFLQQELKRITKTTEKQG